MSRPIAVFRYRKRFFWKALRETLGGLGIALLFYAVPYLFQERVWPLLALFLGLIGVVAFCLVLARRRETGTIALYEDQIVWQDHRGRRQVATYDRITKVVPDLERHRHFVHVLGTDGFAISPEIERFTELWRRLYHPNQVRGAMPPGREEWTASRTFRPSRNPIGAALLLFLIALFIARQSVQVPSVGISPSGVDQIILSLIVALFGVQQLMTAAFERIEIEGRELIHRSWMPGVQRRIPLGAITGACLYESRSLGDTGVIDTDRGEVRFRFGYTASEELVREAERLGTARFAETPILSPVASHGTDAQVTTERSLTA